MIKKEVNKNDHLRVLLTDTLPYETPLPFSNFYFHALLRRQAHEIPTDLNDDLTKGSTTFFVPYNYRVAKLGGSHRTLSVPHPRAQYDACNFYKKYDGLLIEYCSRSSFSIRKPARVADYFYEKGLSKPATNEEADDQPVETEAEPFGPQSQTASSYFVYRRYNLLYKFFDDYKFIELEKKYRHLTALDVSKCFYNIYTHSISWAVKSKDYSKNNLHSISFEEDFDRLMQKSNYNETHGILVGPEVSRIFAEVIFQRIDVDVGITIEKEGFFHGRDYVIKRYVDDYFIFTNDERVSELATETIRVKLEEYKLYLNTTKTNTTHRPFISPISISKIKASQSIENFFNSIYSYEDKELSSYRKITRAKLSLINELRSISAETGAAFDSFGKFALSIITRKSINIYRKIRRSIEDDQNRSHFLALNRQLLQVIFYLYAMDCGVRATYIVCRFIIFINNFCGEIGLDVLIEARRSIFEFSTQQLRTNAKQDSHASIGTLNLLVVLRALGNEYLLPQDVIEQLFRIKPLDNNTLKIKSDTFGYFQIVVLLYYIEDLPQYSKLKTALKESVLSKFINYESRRLLPKDTEGYLLLLDLVSCPWLDDTFKKSIIGNYVNSKHPGMTNISNINKKINSMLLFAKKRLWFFDWESHKHLEALLLKKELRSPY